MTIHLLQQGTIVTAVQCIKHLSENPPFGSNDRYRQKKRAKAVTCGRGHAVEIALDIQIQWFRWKRGRQIDAHLRRLTVSIVYPSKLIICSMFFPLFTASKNCSAWILLLQQRSTTCCHAFTSKSKKIKQNTYLRIALTIQSIMLYRNAICLLCAFGVFYDYASASLLSEFIRQHTRHCALPLPVTWHLQLSRLDK